MARRMGIEWHLREVMAARGLFNTSDLVGPLAERGVQLSREQVFRLVTQVPQRLNMEVLAAICDILDCGPQDLVEVVVEQKQVRKSAAAGGVGDSARAASRVQPVRARIRRPGGQS
jgi:DNA-binding Xre family transcriptional regulator